MDSDQASSPSWTLMHVARCSSRWAVINHRVTCLHIASIMVVMVPLGCGRRRTKGVEKQREKSRADNMAQRAEQAEEVVLPDIKYAHAL
eukprot:753890-Rhodomonas_salina.1